MWKKFGNLIQAVLAAAMSRKLVMAFIAIWMTYGIYWGAVQQLYTFEKPEQIAAFTTFTNYMMWTTTTIALWYIGIQGAANFSNSAGIQSVLQSVTSMNVADSKSEQTITTVKVDPKDVDTGEVD